MFTTIAVWLWMKICEMLDKCKDKKTKDRTVSLGVFVLFVAIIQDIALIRFLWKAIG